MLRSIGSKRINLWYVECLLTDPRMGRIQGSPIVLVEGVGGSYGPGMRTKAMWVHVKSRL